MEAVAAIEGETARRVEEEEREAVVVVGEGEVRAIAVTVATLGVVAEAVIVVEGMESGSEDQECDG